MPNLQVIKLMQSFKSKEYVKEIFSWQYYYYYLTNEGIEYLREYLNLGPDVVPDTLKKSARPAGERPGADAGQGRVRPEALPAEEEVHRGHRLGPALAAWRVPVGGGGYITAEPARIGRRRATANRRPLRAPHMSGERKSLGWCCFSESSIRLMVQENGAHRAVCADETLPNPQYFDG